MAYKDLRAAMEGLTQAYMHGGIDFEFVDAAQQGSTPFNVETTVVIPHLAGTGQDAYGVARQQMLDRLVGHLAESGTHQAQMDNASVVAQLYVGRFSAATPDLAMGMHADVHVPVQISGAYSLVTKR
jgi:hypothetical protein